MYDEFYSVDGELKNLAVSNQFVDVTSRVCKIMGENLKPFCMFATEKQKEYGVVDFTEYAGLADPNNTLLDEILANRQETLSRNGIYLSSDRKRVLLYSYLLRVAVCYVEVPKYITKNGFAQHAYDKYLCTTNMSLIGQWLNADVSMVAAKYASRVQMNQGDIENNSIRLIRLGSGAKGNTASVPRSAVPVDKMSLVPMYMLGSFVDGLTPALRGGIVKFLFLKDNNTERELVTTLNRSIISQYYDEEFTRVMLSGTDFGTTDYGGMKLSSKISRGYVKVPELGASIYDGTGCRSLNLARVLKAEVVDSVDRTFINVDLNSVVENFSVQLDWLARNNPDGMKRAYMDLLGVDAGTPESIAQMMFEMQRYVLSRSTLLSTQYLRQLHLFLVRHADLFPLYTGRPAQVVTSSSNFGVQEMDF